VRRSALARLVWLVVASSLATGCLGTSPDPRFYTLRALASPEELEGLEGLPGNSTLLGLGVGPIHLPRYLQRPQIVTRRGDHRLEYHELRRWGGTLESEILRVLGRNLSVLLGTDRVAVYPVQSVFPLSYRVRLDVEQFDGEVGGEVRLRVRWVIGSVDGGDALAVGYSSLSQEAGSSRWEDLVRAHGELLATLSREIAQRIRELLQSEDAAEPTSEAEPAASRAVSPYST
jgi:uncharacterized lipoprotein YmbA